MRPDARDEFSGAERLCEIIIGSRTEALNSRFFARACRKHDKWNRPRALILAESFKQTKAIQVRHHHVRQNQVGRIGPDALESGLAVADGFDFKLRREHTPDVFAHVSVVIGKKDAGRLWPAPGGHRGIWQAKLPGKGEGGRT